MGGQSAGRLAFGVMVLAVLTLARSPRDSGTRVDRTMRGRYRILLGMAAGVGKTYRMLQEGQHAQAEGRDVVIGYLEPHDRPETAALAEGLEVVPRSTARHGSLELEEMDVDAVVRRAPELALIDELAHTNASGMRNEKRYEDIDEVLDAGIDVISTVNVQHLESLNDAIFELTETRVRETFPDRILDEADEVVLVDLTPEALQERLRAGRVYPRERASVALDNFFRIDKLSALRELALRQVAEDVEKRRVARQLEPLNQAAVAERVLALVEPQPKSQRIMRRAWRSAQRLGSEMDALWVRRPGRQPTEEETIQAAALRRLAVILGVHFLEEEGDDLVGTVRRVAAERGSTYVFVGTPDESRRREIFGGSLLSRMVRELPGIDIRVVTSRAEREKLVP
jgi:two-component system, OmpR family, sensor histidine kinase KdpD